MLTRDKNVNVFDNRARNVQRPRDLMEAFNIIASGLEDDSVSIIGYVLLAQISLSLLMF